MKRYGRVWTVYRKELLETLRDRRTLMAMILVPIVLYPVLMLVLIEVMKSEAGRQEEEQYRVVVPDEQHKQWLEGVLAREDAGRHEREQAIAAQAGEGQEAEEKGISSFLTHLGSAQIMIHVAPEGQDLWDLVAHQGAHAAVLVDPPPNPDPDAFADNQNRIVQIIYSDTNPLSDVIYRQLNYILENEGERIVQARVKALSGSDAILTPLVASNVSTTSPDRQFAKALALIVPFLLVTMTVTGAMYPAIDLTAGERERGTLETLAVSPVPVGQIVAGKFGVIITIAMTSTVLNLASMTAVIHFADLDKLLNTVQASSAGEEMVVESMILDRAAASDSPLATAQSDNLARRQEIEQGAKEQVGFVAAATPVVLLSMIPFAVLFGAVMLAVCSFARTFKEAQNYMMPVMMSAILPAMIVSYMPTIKLEGTMLVVPVANIVVMMRELFLGNYDFGAMGLCLGSTCFYAVAAVTVANRVYGNEAVLFSDVGSYKTLLLRKYMRPQRSPSAAFALLTVAVIFPIYFYAQSSLIQPGAEGAYNLAMVAATQVVLLLGLAIFLVWYTRIDLARTFSFRLPGGLGLVGALLVAFSIAPVSNLIQQLHMWAFPLSEAAQKMYQMQMQTLGLATLPWWFAVLVLAVVPGFCEEVFFRGFLTAGLRGRMARWKIVIVVGVIFGLFHVSMDKIVLVSLLGMILTFICLRTGSIFPAMLAHIANNGVLVASSYFEGLRTFYGLPAEDAIGQVVFDLRTAIFLSHFVLGILLIAMDRRREA